MKKRYVLLFVVCMAVILLAAQASAEDLSTPIAFVPGMTPLGRGYDALSGTVKANICMRVISTGHEKTGVGHAQWYEFSSSSDIMDLTAIDAGASLNLGLASISTEVGLLFNSQVTNFDFSTLGLASHEVGYSQVIEKALKPEYERMLNTDPERFFEACGNYYVAEIHYGGTLYVDLTSHATSQSDRQILDAKLGGTFGPISADGSVHTDTVALMKAHDTKIIVYKTGSGGVPNPMDPQAMAELWKHWPETIEETGGGPMAVLLAEYSSPNVPYNPLIENLAILNWEYTTVKREVRYVLDHPDQFYMSFNTWEAFLLGLETEAGNAIQRIAAALTACRTNGAGCVIPTELRRPDRIRRDLPPRYIGSCSNIIFPMHYNDETAVYPLTVRCGGDKDMHGHSPRIKIDATLIPSHNNREIDIHAKVQMTENGGDGTCFKDEKTSMVLDLAQSYKGCYFQGAQDAQPADGALKASALEDDHEWKTYGGGTGFVNSADCLADTPGNDNGELGCRVIRLRDITLNLHHDEDRMGPNNLVQSAAAVWLNKRRIKRANEELFRMRMSNLESALNKLQPQIRQTIKALHVPRSQTGITTINPTFRAQPAGQYPKPRQQ